MNAREINRSVTKSQRDFAAGFARRGAAQRRHVIHPATFLAGFRIAVIEHNPIARFERGGQLHDDALPLDALDVAEIDAPLLAEPRVGEFLVVVAAKPAGVEPAREAHFQFVTISV